MQAGSTTRPPLNRQAVLAEGVALADREGIDAVSMRRLAQLLGVVPMALYKHVADKEDLLDGMVAVVIGEFERPARSGNGWKAAVSETIDGLRRTLTVHPWLRRAIETRTRRTPAVLAHMEAVTQLFLQGGFSPDLTHHVMHALGNRIWGFSPELFPEDPTASSRTRRASDAPDPADYPGIMAIATEARRRRPDADGCDEDFEFVFALDLILDAAGQLREAGWSSSARRADIADGTTAE